MYFIFKALFGLATFQVLSSHLTILDNIALEYILWGRHKQIFALEQNTRVSKEIITLTWP